MAKLWEYDEFGEPWLENGRRGNPPLIIVNPKRKAHKKGKKRMARRKRRMPAGLRKYWATHRRGKKASNRKRSRRRRTRRNPWPMAGTVAAVNRRGRKHRSRRRRRNAGRARRAYTRGMSILGISLPPVQSV